MTLFDMPLWLDYLIKGILVFAALAFAGITLTKANKSPYLALFLLVPFVQVVVIWYVAFSNWPPRSEPKAHEKK